MQSATAARTAPTNRRNHRALAARATLVAAAALTFLALQPWTAIAKPPPGIVASPGDLDKTFGGDGIVTTPIGHGPDADQANDVLVQPNGRIVVAGWTNPGGPLGDQNFLVARYLPNGGLDPTFGPAGNGYVTLPVAPGSDADGAEAIARQPDGKLLVAGVADMGETSHDFAVVRLNEDGTLDPTFGGDGTVTIPIGPGAAFDHARDVISVEGDVVLAGQADTGRSTDVDFAVVRLNTDGSLDQGFDGDSGTGNGIVTIPVGPGESVDAAEAIAATSGPPHVSGPPADLVLAGYTDNAVPSLDVAVVRLTSGGELVTSFDGDGVLTTKVVLSDDYADDVLVEPSGRIVVAGAATTNPAATQIDFALVRYLANGALDTSFSGDGIAITHFTDPTPSTVGHPLSSAAHAVVRQPNGHLVAGGFATTLDSFDFDYALARYRPNGSLDKSFGTAGTVTTAIAPGIGHDEAMGLALQSDDKIVAAGSSELPGTGRDISLARYHGRHVYTCFGSTPNDC